MAISMQIWVTITASLPRVRSNSTMAVAMDVVDMLVGGNCKGHFMQGGGQGLRCETQNVSPPAYN